MSENPAQPTEKKPDAPAASTALVASERPAEKRGADLADEAFISVFQNERAFEAAQRMAKALISSDIVPVQYQGQAKLGNALVALEISQRNRVPVLTVMQNLHVIHGRPSWSSQYVIAALNTCGRFEPIEFEWSGEEGTPNHGCRATARVKRTGVTVRGALITLGMAKEEGWSSKTGSKWKTMPEQMMMYRAASFFGKIYAPEVLNGMQTKEEMEDAIDIETVQVPERPALPSGGEKPAALNDSKPDEGKGVSRARRTTLKAERTVDVTPAPAATEKPAETTTAAPAEEKKAEPAPAEKPAEKPAETAAAPAGGDDLVEDQPEKPKANTKEVDIVAIKTGTKASNQEKVYILEVTGEFAGKLYLEKAVYFLGEGKADHVPTVGAKVFVDIEERPKPAGGVNNFILGWRETI